LGALDLDLAGGDLPLEAGEVLRGVGRPAVEQALAPLGAQVRESAGFPSMVRAAAQAAASAAWRARVALVAVVDGVVAGVVAVMVGRFLSDQAW
jgi:glucose/arabinose dehydrogenase